MTINIGRRNLLQLAAAGAGLCFLPSFARAALRAEAPAKRVLVVNLSGGVRSSASLYASGAKKYNPFGLLQGTGASFPVGQLLDDHAAGGVPLPDADYTFQGERLPRFREMVKECSVLGSWDEERGDHIRARLKEPTGSPDGAQPGILTRLAAGLNEQNGKLDVLPFQVAPLAAFGQAASLGQFSPVSLASPRSLPAKTNDSAAEDAATGNDWAKDDAMRERLDRAIIDKRAGNAKELGEIFSTHRRASRRIGARLAEPWVNVGNQDAAYQSAAMGTLRLGGGDKPLTNALLAELFGKAAGAEGRGGEYDYHDQAINAALALRLLQLGAPAVALEITGFDLHSGEQAEGPALYAFFGRLWATLSWAMKRIPDPQFQGQSLYDTTMVLTMSDFGRDPGSSATGFNGGQGSDHGADPGCYYLAHLTMGGGVQPNRLVGEVSTNDYRGDRAGVKFGPRDVLGMILWSLGLDPKNEVWGLADASAPFDALFRT